MKKLIVAFFLLTLMAFTKSTFAAANRNLLLNGGFHFQSFDNSRSGERNEYRSGSVPFWEQENYADAEVFRGPRNGVFAPQFAVDGVVVLHPGKSLWQFALLSEMQLDNGDAVSLSVFGHQKKPDSLKATIYQMRLDNAAGEWTPANFGMADKRTFPKHARGELVPSAPASAASGAENDFELKIHNDVIADQFKEDPNHSDDLPNTIGLKIEFTNTSDQDIWIYAPCLSQSTLAQNHLPDLRALPDYYRSIPRTITKLRRGEPLHIIAMGSSIDRGSANPPQYLYNEDVKSPHFKEPLAEGNGSFDGSLIGHPEWTPYIGQWRHYFSYTGRLRLDLMKRYDYPINKILLNYEACDGSAIGESHSALKEWAALANAPDPNLNGHAAGKSWQDLYPDVFSRPEGARPDLVIFGSGANEKIDGPEEVAAFEGAIRWFQRHYPGVEFIFCMWQNRESYTPNTGMLKDLALRYGIPYIDLGRELDLSTRYINSYALVPRDGHPQTAAHYIWSQLLQRAFEVADPMKPGLPQQYLPERITPTTIGWEGEIDTYPANSPRIHNKTAFILDDTMVNLWASTKDKLVTVHVDGKVDNGSRRKPMNARDARNSTFATGRLSLGDRHVIEVSGTDSHLVAADSKAALNRVWHGVDSKNWQGISAAEPFASQWGTPYGSSKVLLQPGQSAHLQFAGTACSVAWVDAQKGGILEASVDGRKIWEHPTNIPFQLASGEKVYMENRKGILHLPFGVHKLQVTAKQAPVILLGAFSYDTRANHDAQRTQTGMAAPGDAVTFTAPFAATPLVICNGGLKVLSVTAEKVTFGGDAAGSYQVIGE